MEGLISGEVSGLRARQITDETCKVFNYQKGQFNKQNVQIAPYYDANGLMVAQKLRFKDKTFMVLGDIKDALPFGAQCWTKTGKKIVVTEGEIDALSMSQVQGNKYPVVSISCGAGPQIRKYFAKHKEYFTGFEEVILMFDMDQPGREAAKVAAEVIGAQARIAELPHPHKDANDMLLHGKTEELINSMWKAKAHRPEGIIKMSDLKEEVKMRPQVGLSWPFPTLTEFTYGMRTGEIYALGAGTGVGKTDFLTQTISHLAQVHKVPVGVFSLEQHPRETATRIAGKFAKKTFHIPDGDWTNDDVDAAWKDVEASGNVFLFDSFGNNDWEIIKEKIEYLANAEGVRHFFLDHLTALAAWKDDERKALEVIMSDMGSLVKRLDVFLGFVSHLATPEGKPHEEGGRVMIRHYKGSRAIGFWSHFVIALERDQQNANDAVRTTTVVRMLKDRYTGRSTGKTFYMGYDQNTGMLFETGAPEGSNEDPKKHGFTDETKDDSKEGNF